MFCCLPLPTLATHPAVLNGVAGLIRPEVKGKVVLFQVSIDCSEFPAPPLPKQYYKHFLRFKEMKQQSFCWEISNNYIRIMRKMMKNYSNSNQAHIENDSNYKTEIRRTFTTIKLSLLRRSFLDKTKPFAKSRYDKNII